MRKLFICIATTLITGQAFAVSIKEPVIGGDLVAGLSCELLGYKDDQSCPPDVTKPIICTTETCTLISCPSECICAPNYSYCTSSGGGTTCTKTCTDGTWTTVLGESYQSRQRYALNRTTCECVAGITEYRCAPGYYDTTPGVSTILEIPECTKCPDPDGTIYAGRGNTVPSSAGGSKSVTACYIPMASGSLLNTVTITDTSGTYQFTDDCYYTN